MSLLTTLLLLTPSSPLDPQAQAVAQPRAVGKVTVPMEVLKSKHIAVEIKVNGKGPYRVIFDTGSPVTLLGNRIATEAGLLSKEQARTPALFGARGMGTARTLAIGDLVVENMPVMVMDHPALRAASRALGQLDGIVGFPFFSRYRTTFDYQAGTITFEPVDYADAGGMDLMQMVMLMMNDRSNKPIQKVQSPKTLWGFRVEKAKDDEEPGVTIQEVVPQSPAAEAGLEPGDRLLELDDVWTESVEDTYRAASGVAAGQKVKAKIKRGQVEKCVTIVPRAGL
ncbi:MAG: aspartyl protease family protein [Gemmatales bacterium]|nr:aspartyl protease family protein [Gemmatales bacterium]MDW8386057.1 aspartyl protease family protein [Gemmatales bacterium]